MTAGRPRAAALLAELGRFLRSNAASGAATALDWAVVTTLVAAGLHYLGAAAAGASAGAVTDFLLKRHWAFGRTSKGSTRQEGVRYLLVSASSLLWNLAVSWGLVDGLGLPAVPGVIAASIVVGVLWNYPLHRHFVFRSPRPWAVVCDFDGTATLGDLADALSIASIGRERWQQAEDAFQGGAINFEGLLHAIFDPIVTTEEAVRDFARTHARFRPGFERLVRTCRERGIPFIVASGGLDLYIRPALELLPAELAAGLEVRANHAEIAPDGLRLTFPWRDAPGACGSCGSCKGALVRELQRRGHRVVAVGDGNADRCMAGVADVLFARGRLLAWCRAGGIPCVPFETLDAVADQVAAGPG
jgi:2-hydroxy-3-keto-5-methylthiopentenyl-1-phosphate phosphatase